VDDGRRWAIETFGAQGVAIRERIPVLVREEHTASADAQDASGHRSQSVYGQFWRGILERFEEFGRAAGNSLLRPGQAPYKIPVINGVALFPWRYGTGRAWEVDSGRFTTSDARIAMFDLKPGPVQGELGLGLPRPGLTAEEQEFADTVEKAISDSLVTARKLVVVAISSSSLGLHDLQWGEAGLTGDGYLRWGFNESLMTLQTSLAPVTDSATTFTSGEPPTKAIRRQEGDDTTGDATKAGDE
jgi:hypothetical protein